MRYLYHSKQNEFSYPILDLQRLVIHVRIVTPHLCSPSPVYAIMGKTG